MKRVGVPKDESEMNAAWIAAAFDCDPAAINSVEAARDEEAKGLFGAIVFLKIDAPSQPQIPDELVCKFVPPDPRTAEAVKLYAVFEREELFYREFAPHLTIRTPVCHASEYDPDNGAGFLLLEDCSRMQTRRVDEEVPTSIPELMQVASTAARLCRDSWGQPWLIENQRVMRPGERVWESYFENQTGGWKAYLEHNLRAHEADGFSVVASQLASDYAERLRRSWPTERLSLEHVDFHCGNYFVDDEKPEDPIVVFDWQGLCRGRTAHDLACILAASFPPEIRRQQERLLVRHFHDQLGVAITTQYSLQECWSDYLRGILIAMRLIPQFVTEIDMSTDYGARVGRKIVRNLSTAAMDHGGLEFLAQF